MQSMSVVVKMFSACFCFFLGTGKTVVGTHIVYWFHKLNEESVEKDQTSCLEGEKHKKRKCILYCGPSNKSVDVVAGNYRLLSPRSGLYWWEGEQVVWRGRKWGWSLQKTLHCRERTSGDGMMSEGQGGTGLSITTA